MNFKKLFKNEKIIIISVGVFILLIVLVLVVIDKYNLITKLGLSPTLWTSVIAMTIPLTITILLWEKEKKERIDEMESNKRLQKQLTVRAKYVEYFEDMIVQLRDFEIFIDCYLKNRGNPFGFSKSKEEILEQQLEASYRAIRGECEYADMKEVWKFDFNAIAFKSIDIDIFNYKYNEDIISLRADMRLLYLVKTLNSIREGWSLELQGLNMYTKELRKEESKKIILEILNEEKFVEEVKSIISYLKKDIEERLNI